MADAEQTDRLEIRDLIDNWAVWRDAGDWERFATVWHDDGWMSATWFQGTAADFIRVSKEGWAKGVSILHFQGGMSIDLAGTRAIAQTKMTISQRGPVHGVVCDVLCTGRFFDFLEKRNRWLSMFAKMCRDNEPCPPQRIRGFDERLGCSAIQQQIDVLRLVDAP